MKCDECQIEFKNGDEFNYESKLGLLYTKHTKCSESWIQFSFKPLIWSEKYEEPKKIKWREFL
ncbi:hypothetical protein C4565_00360 [Candidatus Parcubacteria bacterium]|nr:MAG: hypothetical protein C4565_00360 [Candidatus Parcubacteria bacterium]